MSTPTLIPSHRIKIPLEHDLLQEMKDYWPNYHRFALNDYSRVILTCSNETWNKTSNSTFDKRLISGVSTDQQSVAWSVSVLIIDQYFQDVKQNMPSIQGWLHG